MCSYLECAQLQIVKCWEILKRRGPNDGYLRFLRVAINVQIEPEMVAVHFADQRKCENWSVINTVLNNEVWKVGDNFSLDDEDAGGRTQWLYAGRNIRSMNYHAGLARSSASNRHPSFELRACYPASRHGLAVLYREGDSR